MSYIERLLSRRCKPFLAVEFGFSQPSFLPPVTVRLRPVDLVIASVIVLFIFIMSARALEITLRGLTRPSKPLAPKLLRAPERP